MVSTTAAALFSCPALGVAVVTSLDEACSVVEVAVARRVTPFAGSPVLVAVVVDVLMLKPLVGPGYVDMFRRISTEKKLQKRASKQAIEYTGKRDLGEVVVVARGSSWMDLCACLSGRDSATGECKIGDWFIKKRMKKNPFSLGMSRPRKREIGERT